MERKELEVIARAGDLLRWAIKTMGRLPRHHRYVVGERVEANMLGVLEQLMRAKYARQKRGFLEEASIRLDLVRHEVRILHDEGMLREGGYGDFCEKITEVGRQVGGWMKAAR